MIVLELPKPRTFSMSRFHFPIGSTYISKILILSCSSRESCHEQEMLEELVIDFEEYLIK